MHTFSQSRTEYLIKSFIWLNQELLLFFATTLPHTLIDVIRKIISKSKHDIIIRPSKMYNKVEKCWRLGSNNQPVKYK